jgi:hypothetical protein
MTKQSHTPGPWVQITIKGQRFITGPDRGTVATIPPLNRFPQQAEANARLIAAAPDQNEALHEAHEIFSRIMDLVDNEDVLEIAQKGLRLTAAVLAKAEG